MSKQMNQLWKLCKAYIAEQEISCPESIIQNDNVLLNAHEFLEKLCDIVGYYDPPLDN